MLLPARHVQEGHLPSAPLWLSSTLLSRPSPWHPGFLRCTLLRREQVLYLNGTFAWW